ncbi:hypothetical protein [Streptomyces achromogenes]|uniref:imine reductase family protein n=1 Tax=Streptomyces achromogenes TaxID=67255 RepID=UPI0036FC7108
MPGPSSCQGAVPGTVNTLETARNALNHITRASEEQGVHSGHPRLMKEIAERAVTEGHGGANYLAVYEMFKKTTSLQKGSPVPRP